MSGSHVVRILDGTRYPKGNAIHHERILPMSEFKQQVDPLAEAKAWLAHMEKTLAKLAAEPVLQDENGAGAEGGRPSPNFRMPEAAKRSQIIVAN
jgi:hypothetical protein